MNDLQLIRLVAETDRYPATSPLPEDVAGVDAAFVDMIQSLQEDAGAMQGTGSRSGEGQPQGWQRRGVLLAAAVFAAVLAVGVLIFALSRPTENEVINPPTTTTTEAPTTTSAPTTTTPAPNGTPEDDVAIAEAAIAAWYANEFDNVSRLLAMPGESTHLGWTPDDFRSHMAFDSALGARAEDVNCTTPPEPGGFFRCSLALHNALTDAVDTIPSDELIKDIAMRVVDGKLSRYDFKEHEFQTEPFGLYLAIIGELDGFGDCLRDGPLSAGCAQIQLEHLDGWATWNEATSADDLARAHLDAVFRGDCAAISVMMTNYNAPVCEPTALYEVAINGVFDVTSCTESTPVVQCDGFYSNALSSAVGAAPAAAQGSVWVGDKPFGVWDATRSQGPHPQDEGLLLSFRTWAQDSGLGDQIDEQCGLATPRKTPECASFLMDNLDAWADWYSSND